MKRNLNEYIYPKFWPLWEMCTRHFIGSFGNSPEVNSTCANGLIANKKIFKDAHLFFIDTAQINTERDVPLAEVKNSILDYALPFKTCYFEAEDPDHFIASASGENYDDFSSIAAILVHELSPGLYACNSLIKRFDGSLVIIPSFLGREKQKALDIPESLGLKVSASQRASMETVNIFVENTVYRICQSIHSCKLGKEYIYKTVKLKSITGNENHKINHVIRLRKGESEKKEPLFSREVDWSHQWWVRGHWRQIAAESIGKNRDGIYETRGFTWVTEHLKGPEEKEIVKKVYLEAGV